MRARETALFTGLAHVYTGRNFNSLIRKKESYDADFLSSWKSLLHVLHKSSKSPKYYCYKKTNNASDQF